MSTLRTAALAALAALALDGALLAQDSKQPTSPDQKTEIRREVRVRIGGPWLGVGIDDVDGETKGAKIVSVADSSPASQIGLKDGDVITSFNGQPVEGAMQLRRLVAETPAGRSVTVGYTRNGASQTATVKLAEGRIFRHNFELPPMPPMPNLRAFSFKCDTSFTMTSGDSTMTSVWASCLPSRPRLGVNMTDIAPAAGATDGRVMVTGVIEKTPAAEAGLQPGDVILEVEGTPIHNTGDLQSALRDRKEGPVSLRIKRECEERTLSATLKKPEQSDMRELHLNRNGKQIHIFGNGGNFEFSAPEQIEIELNGMEDMLQEQGVELKEQMQELRERMQQNGEDVDFSLRRLPPTAPVAPVTPTVLRDA